MKTLIISGGNINPDFALSYYQNHAFDRIIGVDNGLQFLYRHQILPTHIVGDFDTADPELVEYYRAQTGIKIHTFPPMKNSTDTQLAIELAIELGSTYIVILGGTGSRLDHVLGNIQSMMLAKKAGVKCELLDPHNRIRLVSGEILLKKAEQYGTYVSLIPLTNEVKGVELMGFKYPLHNHTFTNTESAGLGVSNEIVDKEARIRIREGLLILIESSDEAL